MLYIGTLSKLKTVFNKCGINICLMNFWDYQIEHVSNVSNSSNVKKKTVYHVDKPSLYYLHHPVVHKHDFNNLCYPLLQPLRWVSSLYLILPHILLTNFPDLSSFLCLKCTMYIVFICNSHSFIVCQPIKTTYSG